MARARKSGIQLSPNQLFENQTIAELALFAKNDESDPKVESITGNVELTPIQHWYFEMHKSAPHYWNQIVEISPLAGHNPSVFERISREIIEHHDALRLSFKKENDQWTAEVCNIRDIKYFHLFDLSATNDVVELEERIKKELFEIQQAAALDMGGLFKCIYFETGNTLQDKIYLVAHHLVTDMVSWNIIQKDLIHLVSTDRDKTPGELDKKVSNIKNWADQLKALAETGEILSELPYWESHSCSTQKFPADFKNELQYYPESSIGSLTWTLDEANTAILMQNANQRYNTKTDDLLITALVATIGDWARLDQFCIGMEHHGRTASCLTEDATNIVGWFTAYFPFSTVNISGNALGDQIKNIKEHLRKIPNNGIGYGILKYLAAEQYRSRLQQQPQIVFNYLGNQTKNKEVSGLTFTPVSEGSRHPSSERSYAIEINSLITGGKLVLRWSYTKLLYKEATIKALADSFGEAIKNIIQHCDKKEPGEYTPSDFPEANISQEDLDNLLKGM